MNNQPKRNAFLIGIGLDNHDGHKRLTRAEEFCIVGGSQETHERLTEISIKTFEDLRQRGKTLSTVEREELAEILHKNRPSN